MLRNAIRVLSPSASLLLGAALILGAPQEEGSSPQTPLRTAMEGLKTHLKGTAMAIQGSSRDEALEHVAEMQRLVLLAKLEAPANLEELPEEDRAAHRNAFRRDLVELLKQLADMEIDLLEGRLEEAMGRVVDPLYPMRETAHEKYQSKE